MNSRSALLALSLALASGCTRNVAAKLYAKEARCPVNQVKTSVVGHIVTASGCDGQYVYLCDGWGSCTRLADKDPGSASAGGQAARRPERQAMPSANAKNILRRGKGKAGEPMLMLELELTRGASFILRAAPKTHPDIVQLELDQVKSRSNSLANCTVQIVSNGQPVALAQNSAFAPTDYQEGIRTAAQVDTIFGFQTARQITLSACSQRWALDAKQLELVRSFSVELQQERALHVPANAPAAESATPAANTDI